MGTLTNGESRDINTSSLQLFHLLDETFRINDNAIADDTRRVLAENPRWDKMKRELALVIYNAVSRVTSTLIAHNKIRAHCKFIDDFSLALITPLGTDNCYYRHDCIFLLAF